MAPQHPIPENEQDNFVSLFWQMLVEMEGQVENLHLDRHKVTLVEGGYKILHRCCHFKNSNPRWAQEVLIKKLLEQDIESCKPQSL